MGLIEKCLATPSLLIPFAVMEVHYMRNAGFMKRGQLLANARRRVPVWCACRV